MMYIHYCKNCDSIRILSGHKPCCPACGQALRELKTSFAEYSSLSSGQRLLLLEKERRNSS